MGLIKKGKKKKPLRTTGGAAATQASTKRPKQIYKDAPCIVNCPSGTKIREWIAEIAQCEKQGINQEEAMRSAFNILVETNPFPSMMGRVCPHPCEPNCNRVHKDGAVAINAIERFIGDWSLEKQLPLPIIEQDEKSESIGVIGAGPAGLSFAYQMARRGYPVTVYEATDKAGGMIYWGIPFYREPADVLEAEIQRILKVGRIDLQLNTTVGKDVSVEELKSRHQVIFVGIGAHNGRLLKIPGEQGPGVYTGVDYLHRVAGGERVDIGKSVAIVGGGDTAIDAARMAKRAGADVTILYRRTRVEMPAIESEIEDALKEGIKIEYLRLPIEVKRDGDKMKSVVIQKMELGEPDSSGRRRPVPIEGSEYEIQIDSIIAAVAQDPDYNTIGDLGPDEKWYKTDEFGKVRAGVWTGGDALDIGIATTAIGHGRKAAEAVHAELRGLEPPVKEKLSVATKDRIKFSAYEEAPRAERSHRAVEEWLTKPDEEIDLGISQDQFFSELNRCFSCGLCYGCERCWMFCTPSCFVKVEEPGPGNYYTIKLETCDGCDKCAAECPCGFLEMQ